MGKILEMAERMWSGHVTREDLHPLRADGDSEEIAPCVLFYHSFSNLAVFETADGLVMVDTGTHFGQRQTFQAVRSWSGARLNTAIYSHGHVDHVFGVPPFAQEAREKGWPPPRVVAHEAVAGRFQRYVLTAGYNGVINTRQFQPGQQGGTTVRWPVEYVYPDTTYREALTLTVGGQRFELRHNRGQTDDQTWVWIPERHILCPGDFFEWSAPNAGNPQKVQRYPLEWALALREMAALEAEIMLPGHGAVILGRERVRQALLDTSEYLLSLHDQTVALMNEGAPLGVIVATVRPPDHLLDRPYLQPLYDEPEFIVRNIWRLYGGWYDGVPSNLKPAPLAELGREVSRLAGGVSGLVHRAAELLDAGDLALASHLVDWATAAEPDNPEAHRLRARVYSQRAQDSPTAMTRGIFRAAAAESEAAAQELEGLPPGN